MQQILQYFWQICLLRAGPEHIPSSLFVLGMTFGVYFTLSLLTMFISLDTNLMLMIVTVLIGVAVEASALFGLLTFKRVPQRFNPTLTALLGTTSVVLVIMLPANLAFLYVDPQTMRVIAGLLFLATFVWRLAISGAILARAARMSMLQGAAIIFGIQMIELTINRNLLTTAG